MKWALVFVFLAGLNSTIGNLLLKASRQNIEVSSSFISQYTSASFIGAILFYFLNVLIFAKSLDHLPVNVGYPLLAASGFAMLAIFSWIIYGEKLNLLQCLGLITIIFGIAMLASDIEN